MYQIDCRTCGSSIAHLKAGQRPKYCSPDCRYRYWHEEKKARYKRERAAARADRTCGWCSVSIAHMRKDARWCSKPCANAGVTRERLDRGIPRWKADATGLFAQRCKRYGITTYEFERMLALQENACTICSAAFSEDSHRDVHIDHDHDTGAVRGLLCNRCNVGIGMLGDDVDRLMSAAAYLLAQEDVLTATLPGGFA